MELINKNNSYYLKHSFRKAGKVVTRDHYLGKQVPDNLEQIKEEFLHRCMEEELFKKLRRIQASFSKEWKSYPESMKKKVLIDLSIRFTYNSNAIEGSTITLEETDEIIQRKIAPNKPIDDIKETINHSKVFFEALNSNKPLSLKLLLEWHKHLFSETKPDLAGKIREYPVRVGKYLAPDWQDLPDMLKDFFVWYNKKKNITNPVELAARAHYRFEKIHPFGDGNGRVGRMIIAYILKQNSYPLLVIEYKRRKQYYHALSKPEHNFVNFFMQRYLGEFKSEYLQ
jgi:Fic family protein